MHTSDTSGGNREGSSEALKSTLGGKNLHIKPYYGQLNCIQEGSAHAVLDPDRYVGRSTKIFLDAARHRFALCCGEPRLYGHVGAQAGAQMRRSIAKLLKNFGPPPEALPAWASGTVKHRFRERANKHGASMP